MTITIHFYIVPSLCLCHVLDVFNCLLLFDTFLLCTWALSTCRMGGGMCSPMLFTTQVNITGVQSFKAAVKSEDLHQTSCYHPWKSQSKRANRWCLQRPQVYICCLCMLHTSEQTDKYHLKWLITYFLLQKAKISHQTAQSDKVLAIATGANDFPGTHWWFLYQFSHHNTAEFPSGPVSQK